MKILFICNKNYTSGGYSTSEKVFSGLYNSAVLVSEMLSEHKHNSTVVRVSDYNGIDRQIHLHKPNLVIIEAIWVTPTKLRELQKLHPKVLWVIRIHSEIPFLALEGIALDWIKEYSKIKHVGISCNSGRACKDVSVVADSIHLPNYYPVKDFRDNTRKLFEKKSGYVVNIGCFGAIRPLKNQLIQAIAAIEWARSNNYLLCFHINASRVEQGGGAVLKNIRALFSGLEREKLVEHDWVSPTHFKEVLSMMDICMQVSLSETFNIVSADAVSLGIPIVVSSEVGWADDQCVANPNDTDDISRQIEYVWACRDNIIARNFSNLKNYSLVSIDFWNSFLDKVSQIQ